MPRVLFKPTLEIINLVMLCMLTAGQTKIIRGKKGSAMPQGHCAAAVFWVLLTYYVAYMPLNFELLVALFAPPMN